MEFSSFSSGTESAVIILGASLGTLQDGIMTLDHVERLFMEISSKEYVNHGEDFVSATVKKELPGAMTGFFYYANWKLQSSPATKRWEKIPPLKDGQYYYDIIVLAFDPRLSPHYNVVAVSGTICMVLSSETGGWLLFSQKKFPDFGLDADADATRYSFRKVVHVFFNGILHLLDNNTITVVGVDLERKVCRKMEVPCISEKGVVVRRIGQFANSILRYAYETMDQVVFIWDLIDYDSNVWNLKCTINLQDILLKGPSKLSIESTCEV